MSVYFLRAKGSDLIKIGYTVGDVMKRVAQIQTASPMELELIGVLDDDGPRLERRLHQHYVARRRRGEWFSETPELLAIARGERSDLVAALLAAPSLHEEIQVALTQIRSKRERFKGLRAEAAELAAEWVPAADDAGIPRTEIAQLSGLSRQAVYNLLNEKGGTE